MDCCRNTNDRLGSTCLERLNNQSDTPYAIQQVDRYCKVPPTHGDRFKTRKKGRRSATLTDCHSRCLRMWPARIPAPSERATTPKSELSEHQRAGRIGERAHDIERGAGAVSLLQGPLAHVQLQAKQHAIVGGLRARVAEEVQVPKSGLRALVLGE